MSFAKLKSCLARTVLGQLQCPYFLGGGRYPDVLMHIEGVAAAAAGMMDASLHIKICDETIQLFPQLSMSHLVKTMAVKWSALLSFPFSVSGRFLMSFIAINGVETLSQYKLELQESHISLSNPRRTSCQRSSLHLSEDDRPCERVSTAGWVDAPKVEQAQPRQ